MITTERTVLVPLGPPLTEAFARYQDRNREHFKSSGPLPPTGAEFLEWARRVTAQAEAEWNDDRGARFVICASPGHSGEEVGHEVMGHVAFTQIARGPFQACYLGFGLDSRAVGCGLMKEALQRAIRFVFEELHLHRIMANHVPTNVRSARTLRGMGFVPEGYARDYLFIDGAWRDHVLLALTNSLPIRP